MRSILAAFALFALLLPPAAQALAADMPKAGDSAPGFTLKDQAENDISLGTFHGKWVVLYFYPRDLSPGCSIQAHNFQRDIIQYTEKNAEVVGVSVDSPAKHRKFCEAEELTFTLLSDEKREVTALYGSLKESGLAKVASRNTFVIDPEGVIRKVYTDVLPATHSAELLAELDRLQSKKP